MPSVAFEYSTESERVAIEQAVAFVSEMRRLAQGAPAGQVLAACEGLALADGRDLLRLTLQSAAQARIDADEGKGGPPAAARARPRARPGSAAGTASAS